METEAENQSLHLFASDRPIQNKTEDLLGRTEFSRRIGEAVSNWREKDSLVLAIYGKWGDGKSSVKNMVIEYLGSKSQSRPSVVEFSPWEWADQGQLMEVFFRELYIALGKVPESDKAEAVTQKWKEYSAYLQAGNVMVGAGSKLIRWVLGVMGFSSLVLCFLSPSWLPRVLGILALLALGGTLFSGFLEKLFNGFAKIAEAKELKSKKSLKELKEGVAASLQKLEDPIVVVIDDVDRLRPSEVKTLFQLIKANADFPNIIYLLFFQRDIIENSIKENGVFDGAEYLEKIIQVGFNLPAAQQSQVHSVLFSSLDLLLHEQGLQDSFEQGRWADIFIPGLQRYFVNLRDVNRFISTLSFQVGLLKDNGTFQVNSIDFIALEGIRQFESKVYEGVFDNKEIFTSNVPEKGERETNKSVIDRIVESANDKEAIESLLKSLFPNISGYFGNYYYKIQDIHFRKLNICHRDVFDRYFMLHLPKGDLSQCEIDRAIALASNRVELAKHFRDLARRELLSLFLERFESYKEVVNTEYALSFVTALLDVSDLVSDDHTGFYSISDATHAHRIIYWILTRIEAIDRRREILLDALKSTAGTFLPLDIIRGDLNRSSGRSKDLFYFDESSIDELKTIARTIIDRSVEDNSLVESKHLPMILHVWAYIDGGYENVKRWLNSVVSDDDRLLDVIHTFISKAYSQSLGSYNTKIEAKIEPKSIEPFFNIDDLFQRVRVIERSSLAPSRQSAYDAFLGCHDRFKNPDKYKERR